MRSSTQSTLIQVGAVGVGAWIVYKLLANLGGKVGDALTAAGEATGGTLYDWFHPGEGASAENVFYTVEFPGGLRHAIESTTVNADGTFVYRNGSYKLATNSLGYKIAVPQ